ncbi:hypothetical protein [Corallococcus exercitus]|uniref:hypothetical protein n=1 Tax=Corallococcus exercitus TaxID=2316736 RepID=UPI0035D48B71
MGCLGANLSRCLAGWILLFLCGCPAGPREVELTLTLGAEQVEVQALLRDVQVWTRDPAEGLLAFQQVQRPEAPFAAELLRRYAWLPRLQRWEWRVREEALDLGLVGSMPRADFDTCLAMPVEERTRGPAGTRRCEGFPLVRSGEAYQVAPGLEPSRSREPAPVVITPMRWPLDTRKLQARVLVDKAGGVLAPSQGSALPFFRLEADAPEGVAAYGELVGRLRRDFTAGKTQDCKALQSEADRRLPPRVRSLFREQVERERLGLMEALLTQQGLRPVRALPKPPERVLTRPADVYAPALLPSQRPPEVLLLRLARLYDFASVPFGVDAGDGREPFSVSLGASGLQDLCKELGRRAPAWRRPCQHLTDTASP